MNDLQTILNQIKNEIVNIFSEAVQINLSRVEGQADRTVYSIDAGELTRMNREIDTIPIRREIILRIASRARIRGLNLDDDLNEKAAFSNDIENLIVNIERNSAIRELDIKPIRLIKAGVLKELALEDNSVAWECQLRFELEKIHPKRPPRMG